MAVERERTYLKMNIYHPATLTYLVLLLVTFVYGTVYRRYQNYPPPTCPINAVCAQIYALPSRSTEATYFNFITCKCPTGLYCPTKPGSQTILTEPNRWYGLCRSVDDIKPCESGEDAEEILLEPRDFDGQIYTRIQCQCPSHELTGSKAASVLAGTTTDSSEAKTIYHLMCAEDDFMTKRGRYGGSNRRKFYFYK